MNFQDVRTFQGGYSRDLTNNVERKETFQKGLNGRLYSQDGVVSFSGGAGTKLIWQSDLVVKYLGYYQFDDELIVFAKCLPQASAGTTEENCTIVINSANFSLIENSSNNTAQNVTSELTDNSSISEECITTFSPEVDETEFNTPFYCNDAVNDEIDFAEYYEIITGVPNYVACNFATNTIPPNNEVFYDCIISLTIDSNYQMVGEFLWVGTQNWPINGKITTEGVEENEFYKRVYYTDALNPRRVVNRKDPQLQFRQESEFNQIVNNTLLQPELVEIIDGGQLPAMKTQYVYRKVSENGQLSEFSPASFMFDILAEDEAVTYRGGNVSEVTGKSVKIKINTFNPNPSSEIECLALEYEAFGPPTAIRNLGRVPEASVVEFTHYGNEPEFADNITYNDLLNFTNTWKFCNAYTSKKNKLIAGGLRNEPIPTAINNLEYLFPLHSWDINGNTHDCLINPEPWTYRYIDPSNIDSLIYIKEKVYRNISSFGPTTIKLVNQSTGDYIELEILNLSLNGYTSINSQIADWLVNEQATNANFSTYFPNLNVTNSNGQTYFTPIDELIQTDMSNYVFQSDNPQYLENFNNNVQFINVAVNTANLIHGAQSAGFNDGNGIRVTYKEFKEPLLNQATQVYNGTGNVLDYITPSGEKYFMKGEIYRLGFQGYNNDSTRLFTTILGDIMIPEIGDLKLSIDNNGNAVITSETYTNQVVEDGILYGCGIKLHIEVRLSCELQALIPMYQLVYVERTEENRTILCQGISAPLERVQTKGDDLWEMPDELTNKWNLPYYGGPTYEKLSFEYTDVYGENDQYEGSSSETGSGTGFNGKGRRRVYANRRLMYFDSPDLYFNKISSELFQASKYKIIGKLNTDHTPNIVRQSGEAVFGDGEEVYPKFSRKILHPQIDGDINADELPRVNVEENLTGGTFESYFINVSVYSNYTPHNAEFEIDVSKELNRGEVISGAAFGLDNDVSNNACCLPYQPWYYGGFQRQWEFGNQDEGTSTIFRSAMTSPGYKTMMVKLTENLFTPEFFGELLPNFSCQIRLSTGAENRFAFHWDTIPLINIFRNNRESVYGGRSEQAYSQNTYIPLSKTIPTLQSSNATQVFDVSGDTLVTLNIRVKNDAGDDEIIRRDYNNHGSGGDAQNLEDVWTRNGAWVYCVVLESQVESKFSYEYEFYRETGTHNFETVRGEIINSAYFNVNNFKEFIPKPFKFRDDPNLGNVIAVSDVKLAGEYYDSWTVFKVNNFYAQLEKNKGDISNLVKEDEEVFAIQSLQTSHIYIGTDRIVQDADGNPINIQQGSGTVVDGHKIISNYGTSIRRAVIESDYGFTFFDEREIEFVKIAQPLLMQNLLHLYYFNLFKQNKIIDTEPYFDTEHKETGIRIRTRNGNNFVLSYNEKDKVFNGEFEIDPDLFLHFDKKVYAPITTGENENLRSKDLHQLHAGDILNFFNEEKDLVIGVYVNADINKVFQYKTLGIVTNLDYPIEQVFVKSNLGYDRTMLGTHEWYKIREGIHTVPAINETNEYFNNSDVRGNWVYVEITVKSKNKNKVNILALLNDLRYSHQ